MKIKLVFCSLFCALLCNAQSLNDDDLQHLAAGAVISGGTYAIVYSITENKKKAFWYSLGMATLAGLSKEMIDEGFLDGYFDESEFAATVAGGLVVSVSLDIFIGKEKEKQKKKVSQLRYKPPNDILSR